MTRTLALALVLAATASACITPNVITRTERSVADAAAEPAWRAALPDDLPGGWESVRIEGDAAATFLRIEYWFSAAGTYSGAALAAGEAGPEFQTLTGSWSITDGEIELGDGTRARAQAAPGWLKLDTDGGIVVLRTLETH